MEFTLRPFNPGDVKSLVKYGNNEKIARNMADRFPHPYLEENAVAFINHVMNENPVCIFAIDINGEAVGGIGLHPQADIMRKNAELGYWLGEPFWGKGIVTRAVVQMVEYGFQNLPIDRIFARPFGVNKASQKVLEKAGFVLEGKFERTFYKNGIYHDELVYAIRKG
ncbi:GNAT family N-acetyltransferase [Flavihumibacter rivuli]|uniref:GNAT family N-acetyltransferase n=1 Tax=Flavihumibacter rivuli TaxID=2838156 RepID=UPI001BDDCFE6|nr:GNAT family protein [Flavihumibacter rivuli]ULQ56706.1 GNAT family N-acetyltransferase [Flavihumibacter rivuli]